jgi:predicted HTH transcriptional regulator
MAKKKAPETVQQVLPLEEPAPQIALAEGTEPEAKITAANSSFTQVSQSIREFASANPEFTEQQIAKHFGLNVRVVRKDLKDQRSGSRIFAKLVFASSGVHRVAWWDGDAEG